MDKRPKVPLHTLVFHERRGAKKAWLRVVTLVGLLAVAAFLAILLWASYVGPSTTIPGLAWPFLLLVLLGALMGGQSHEIRIDRSELATRRGFWRWKRLALHEISRASAKTVHIPQGSMVGFPSLGGERNFYKGIELVLETRKGGRLTLRSIEPALLLRALDKYMPTSASRKGAPWDELKRGR